MNRPTWATIVGIICIILGCLGIMGAGYMMVMPKMMDMQKQTWDAMQKAMENQGKTNPQQMPPKEMFKAFEQFWNMPPWFRTWCAVGGLIGVALYAFYIFAAIMLLQTKLTGIALTYWALGLAMAFTLLKGVVAMRAMSLVGLVMMFGGIFGIVINVILLVVVATGGKEAFYLRAEPDPAARS